MMTLLFLSLTLQLAGSPGEWSFDVRHDHAFGSCRGLLIISDESIRYEPGEGDHAREWNYPEVESFEIISAGELRIHTYESTGALRLWRDEAFTFLLDGPGLDSGVYDFLAARSPRPIRTHVVFDPVQDVRPGAVLWQLPVRHDHLLGGCQGTLDILEDRIVYRTDHPDDSRVWRLADIDSFASTGDFDLRISNRTESYHFDLMVPLGQDTYRHIWEQVHETGVETTRGNLR